MSELDRFPRVHCTGGLGLEAPVFPDDSPLGERITRRIKGFGAEILGFVLITVLFPALFLVAVLVDLALWLASRKPWMASRLLVIAWWFLSTELIGFARTAFIKLTSGGDGERRRRLSYNLRMWWARRHLGMAKTVLGLRFEVEGLDQVGPTPVVILIRHASIIDNLLPDALAASGHGIGLRYIIKRELQGIPLIDVVGRWVPTIFVRRASGNPEAEVAIVRTLAEDVGEAEGFLIYPEGTRFTTTKLERAKEIIRERQPDYAERAEQFVNLLPPRLGGPSALLEETAGMDVVVCGHVGFDGFQYISHIWAGGLVGTTIRVRFERFSAESIPSDEGGRIDWLYERWLELDRWISAQGPR